MVSSIPRVIFIVKLNDNDLESIVCSSVYFDVMIIYKAQIEKFL